MKYCLYSQMLTVSFYSVTHQVRDILLTFIWEFHYIAYHTMAIMPYLQLSKQIKRKTSRLPNQSQQNVVADLTSSVIDAQRKEPLPRPPNIFVFVLSCSQPIILQKYQHNLSAFFDIDILGLKINADKMRWCTMLAPVAPSKRLKNATTKS